MKVLITGGTVFVSKFIAEYFAAKVTKFTFSTATLNRIILYRTPRTYRR